MLCRCVNTHYSLVQNSIWRRSFLASFVAAMALFSNSAEAVQLFIIAGQSNASGRGSQGGLPTDLRLQFDVPYWHAVDNFPPSNDPSTGERAFDIVRPLGTIGPEIGAAHILADAIADEVVIVKVSQGGTTLTQLNSATDWSVDSTGELYDRLLLNVNLATADLVADGKQVELAGVFWMQGESDAKSGTGAVPAGSVAAYQDNLERFIQQLRTDLTVPQLPFFVGQIKIGNGTDFNTSVFGTYDFTPEIQAAQAAAAAGDPDTYLIDTSNFALKNDFLHFNQTGQLDMGMAFANSYLQTVPEPSTAWLGGVAFATMLCGMRKV